MILYYSYIFNNMHALLSTKPLRYCLEDHLPATKRGKENWVLCQSRFDRKSTGHVLWSADLKARCGCDWVWALVDEVEERGGVVMGSGDDSVVDVWDSVEGRGGVVVAGAEMGAGGMSQSSQNKHLDNESGGLSGGLSAADISRKRDSLWCYNQSWFRHMADLPGFKSSLKSSSNQAQISFKVATVNVPNYNLITINNNDNHNDLESIKI